MDETGQNKALSAVEVAQLLMVSKNTVYEMVHRGELNSYKVGRKLRFDQEDVDSYISRSRHEMHVQMPPVKAVEVKSPLLTPPQDPNGDFIISGQDILLDMLSNYLREYGVPALRAYAGSFESLLALYQDKAQAAAAHLWDGHSDSYNLPFVRMLMPGTHAVLINISYRTQGFYVRKGNPKGIHGWEDLGREDVLLLNRRRGSASRILLDEKLMALGIDTAAVHGYNSEIGSHLTLAGAVGSGEADVGLGTGRVCRRVEGIEFIPLQEERYDLVVKREQMSTPQMNMILDVLNQPSFRRELAGIDGNNYRDLGRIMAEI